MAQLSPLSQLSVGTQLLVGGDGVITVDAALAASFKAGDALAVAGDQVLHLPAHERAVARGAVDRATQAFEAMSVVTDAQILQFFQGFADRLADDMVWRSIQSANQQDIDTAKARGRSTTRLEATPAMRQSMIGGLRGWAETPSPRGKVYETVDHGSWSAELVGAELGVVAFVFEGRPNVVADATGVLRSGNTVVFRIGRDALGTAKALLELATRPALREAGLPEGAVGLVDSSAHASGWALFSDQRLALAVARGSGPAVDTLGALAQSAGVPVSLHGTGGAWLCASTSASERDLEQVVFDSLDRKVCNTLNTLCLPAAEAERLVPAVLRGLQRAAERRATNFKLHVTDAARPFVPAALFTQQVGIDRADGAHQEPQAQRLGDDRLGEEWEWENSPEMSLTVVGSLDDAARLFNAQSPRFVACLLSTAPEEHDRFYAQVNAPFVGDGFTRWVDGQYALKRPELGLSNWQHGRLLGRGGILSGDSVITLRTRVRGTSTGKPQSE